MDRTEKPRPRVVLIAAEQALLGTDRPWLERMGAISLPARGVMNAFPAWTTTLVTGVDPLVHDIVDSMVIDPETLETRAVNSGDCRFSTIWLEGASHGLATASIDWPASNLSKQISNVITPSEMTALTNRRTPLPEDLKLAHTTAAGLDDPEAQERWKPRLTAMLGRTRGTLEAARNALASDTPPDLLTLAIRDSRQFANAGGDARPARTAMRALLQAFIENIPANTTCIVVEHRMADRNRKPVESDSHQGLFEFHVFGLSAEHDTKTTHSIKSTATAIRNMLGLPNPGGRSSPHPFAERRLSWARAWSVARRGSSHRRAPAAPPARSGVANEARSGRGAGCGKGDGGTPRSENNNNNSKNNKYRNMASPPPSLLSFFVP